MAVPAMSRVSSEIASGEMNQWFRQEVQPHESSLRAYLRARFPTLPDLDDLVQETYARLIHCRISHAVTSPKALLFATARNAAVDFFRRQQIVSIECMADFERLSVLEDAPNAAEDASHAQEIELLKASVRALPDRCRQVVTLRMIYGQSHKQIAQQLGIAENTVNNQLSIGLERCRQFLTARGMNGSGNP